MWGRATRFATACAFAAFGASSSHPVVNVIDLLKKLGDQVEAEHKDEEILYVKFERWYQNAKASLEKAIAENTAKDEQLTNAIDGHKQNIESLEAAISQHAQELLDLDAADSKADTVRNTGKSVYTEESGALGATIEAIDECINILKSTKDSVTPALVQRARALIALAGYRTNKQQLEALSFLAGWQGEEPRPELKATGDYGAHTQQYAFKSDSVIEMLKQLQLKFEDELTKANTEETTSLNAYNLAKSARQDARTAATAAKSEKELVKGEAETDLAQAQADLTSVQGDLQADKDSLSSTTKAYEVKKSEWAERSDTRTKEKAAIAAAITILAKVTGVRTEAPTNPTSPTMPTDAGAGLLQQGANGRGHVDGAAATKALNLLRAEAKAEHSKALESLADALATTTAKKGPYDDVINMIEKLIFREMHDQTEEDKHKQWCDLEISKTQESIADKTTKLDELAFKISEIAGTVAELAGEVTAAREMSTKIAAHMEEATEIRKVGKEENRLAKKDAEDAQVQLANAIAVLEEFYKSSGQIPKESWEFLQGRVQSRIAAPVDLPEEPSTWAAGYTGVADPKNPTGVLTVLETISADFAKMASQTEAQENSDQDAYEQDMKESEIEKARRDKEAEMKEQEIKRLNEKKASLEANHKNVDNEKLATEQYEKDLQPACVDGDSTYEDRKAARAKTIEALKQAQAILESDGDSLVSSAPLPALLAVDASPASKSFLQLRGSKRL